AAQHFHQDIVRPCRQFSCGKDACRQVGSQTSETATHQDLLCECFVAYIRVASYPPTPPLRRRRIFRHRAEGQGWRNQSSELLVRFPASNVLAGESEPRLGGSDVDAG